MKYNEFKESLKKKATNLKEIKIGLKEKQRTMFFNSFDMKGNHHGWIPCYREELFTPEQLRRHRLAERDYEDCLISYSNAYSDYRARHIAISLFRGKTPKQIENNYYDVKWKEYKVYDKKKGVWGSLQGLIDKHLKQLRLDNPPREEYDTEYMRKAKPIYDFFNEEYTV